MVKSSQMSDAKQNSGFLNIFEHFCLGKRNLPSLLYHVPRPVRFIFDGGREMGIILWRLTAEMMKQMILQGNVTGTIGF